MSAVRALAVVFISIVVLGVIAGVLTTIAGENYLNISSTWLDLLDKATNMSQTVIYAIMATIIIGVIVGMLLLFGVERR
ncbi:hypothetical protein DRO58_00925 [Candidatus Bathyarchaeota archaeon]|nr:MAG: hypothetical protein DRO58_00925 [Candidatus Bathyarchaeota archaeon]